MKRRFVSTFQTGRVRCVRGWWETFFAQLGRLNISPLVFPTRVQTTLPVVFRGRDARAAMDGCDDVGLLSEITASLAGMRLSIVGAKIQTSVDDDSETRTAHDTFSIVDVDTGLPVRDPRRLTAIEATLNHTLTTPAPLIATSGDARDTVELSTKLLPPPPPPNAYAASYNASTADAAAAAAAADDSAAAAATAAAADEDEDCAAAAFAAAAATADADEAASAVGKHHPGWQRTPELMAPPPPPPPPPLNLFFDQNRFSSAELDALKVRSLFLPLFRVEITATRPSRRWQTLLWLVAWKDGLSQPLRVTPGALEVYRVANRACRSGEPRGANGDMTSLPPPPPQQQQQLGAHHDMRYDHGYDRVQCASGGYALGPPHPHVQYGAMAPMIAPLIAPTTQAPRMLATHLAPVPPGQRRASLPPGFAFPAP